MGEISIPEASMKVSQKLCFIAHDPIVDVRKM
jgi:hypothetical protein